LTFLVNAKAKNAEKKESHKNIQKRVDKSAACGIFSLSPLMAT
jgi:hypothetical protein